VTTNTDSYSSVAHEIERVGTLREQVTLDAFEVLEQNHSALAQYVVLQLHDRRRAAHWMARHHRAFEGASAYQRLAEGDDGAVWDLIERATRSRADVFAEQ
jgi:hypothetical protein